jgi:glyoxylase I family protein
MYQICVNQINIHDMDKAIEFYCHKMGFKLSEDSFLPQIAQLEGAGITLILNKVDQLSLSDYPRSSQILLNFQTENLLNSMKELKSKGVEFIHSEPQECPVGVFAAFKDQSGNVHEMVEFR